MCSLYYGAMEVLQTLQYFVIAEPDDQFSMCHNSTNQFLTFVALLHVAFQPVFCNLAIWSMHRHADLRNRLEADFVNRLCLFNAAWWIIRYVAALYSDSYAGQPSVDCPNYEMMVDGYDGSMQFDVPNLPRHSCTYRSPSGTGHLAWAVPMYQTTYLMPSVSLHCFLFFAPALVSYQSKFDLRLISIILFLTGPGVVNYMITDNLGEQPAIWCVLSVVQCGLLTVAGFFLWERDAPEPICSHPGQLGESPLEYQLVEKATNGTNGHANGKKVN